MPGERFARLLRMRDIGASEREIMVEKAFESKGEARGHYRALREALGSREREKADASIAREAAALSEFASAALVFSYLSVGAEVDTRELIQVAWKMGKTVAVPRCVPGSRLMEWHVIDGFDSLEAGSFGIEEPPDDPQTLLEVPDSESGEAAIAFVPAFSFDDRGFRLGYGGGFYDTFLPEFGGVSVGLCRDCQMSAVPLPRDVHDVAVDVVVTESGRHDASRDGS